MQYGSIVVDDESSVSLTIIVCMMGCAFDECQKVLFGISKKVCAEHPMATVN